MNESNNKVGNLSLEIVLRLSLVALILVWCFQIISPFISLILWGAIIAVSAYSPFLSLAKKLNEKKTRSSVLMTALAVITIIVPLVFLSGSLIDGASELGKQIKAGTLQIDPPADSVQSWPLVGDRVFNAWNDASSNLSSFVQEHKEQIKTIGQKLIAVATGVGAGLSQFIVSIIIAGVFLAYANSIVPAMQNFMRRLVGDQGEDMLILTVATIRSITIGVIGIALFQGIAAGIIMMMGDIPGAGLIAGVIFVGAIAQIPTFIFAIPVIIYQFSVADPTSATLFAIAMIIMSLSDNILKPLLLGRGVDAPMLVILLGAIGGMLLSGVVGLFTGSVVLAMGYTLFLNWLNNSQEKTTTSNPSN